MINEKQSAGKTRTLTTQLAYLLGVYLGDGCVCFVPKYGNYFFSIDAIDKEFVEKTATCLGNVFGKTPPVFLDNSGGGWKKRGTKPLWKTVYYGKKDCEWLVEITESKRIIPQMIWEASKELQRHFIVGVMDSEGFVGKLTRADGTHQYQMGIGSADVWLENFIELLCKHGVRAGSRYKEKQKEPWHKPKFRYAINTESYIKSKLGFSIERKTNRLIEYIETLSPQRLYAKGLHAHDIVQNY